MLPNMKQVIQKILSTEPHRVQTKETLMKLLKLLNLKDPQKQAENEQKLMSELVSLTKDGFAMEIDEGLFKARVFLDKDKDIEHVYIGGMGNTRCRFNASIFRINMGVLSVYFALNKKTGYWRMMVRDSTIGRDYGIVRRLRDGTFLFGNRPLKKDETDYLQIKGRYIEPEQLTLTLSGENLLIEDQKTPSGTRIDFFVPSGLSRYQKAAEAFMKSVPASKHRDGIARGRFVMDQVIKNHQNYEVVFFGVVVDAFLEGNA